MENIHADVMVQRATHTLTILFLPLNFFGPSCSTSFLFYPSLKYTYLIKAIGVPPLLKVTRAGLAMSCNTLTIT